MRWGVFPPLKSSGRICVELTYCFLNYLAELPKKTIWAWNFLCGKMSYYKFNLFFFNFFNVYLFLKETETECEQGWGRER